MLPTWMFPLTGEGKLALRLSELGCGRRMKPTASRRHLPAIPTANARSLYFLMRGYPFWGEQRNAPAEGQELVPRLLAQSHAEIIAPAARPNDWLRGARQ